MISPMRRVLCVLLTLFALSFPLAAQGGVERSESAGQSFLTLLWERLASPFVSLWAADGTDGGQTPTSDDPPKSPLTDGRSVIDPLG